MNRPSKKRQLTDEERQECEALNALYKAKKKSLGLTQELIAIEGLKANSQSAANHYLLGKNALNVEAAAVFARYLQEPVESFSPRLARDREACQDDLCCAASKASPDGRRDSWPIGAMG